MNPIRVLILDDDPAVRYSLGCYLEDTGFDVRVAPNADEATRLLDQCPSDVAIVDLRLPGTDGESFIHAIHARHPALRFIIHTGSAAYDLPQSLRRIGMSPDHVFRKPAADLALLAQAIAMLNPNDGSHTP